MRLPGNQIVEETFDLLVKTIADLAVSPSPSLTYRLM
jgi:hypothetical protein